MKFILSMTCVTLSMLAFATTKTTSPDAPKLQRFEFSGLEARVFYNAESPLEKGSSATLAVVHVHGWGSGVGVAKEEIPLIQALRAAAAMRTRRDPTRRRSASHRPPSRRARTAMNGSSTSKST